MKVSEMPLQFGNCGCMTVRVESDCSSEEVKVSIPDFEFCALERDVDDFMDDLHKVIEKYFI